MICVSKLVSSSQKTRITHYVKAFVYYGPTPILISTYLQPTMGSSEATLNQTKKIAETGTSQWSYIVMEGAKIFHGHY